MALIAPRAEYRLLGIGMTFGVWLALVARRLERKLAGTVGLYLLVLGTWALEYVRKFAAGDRGATS